MSWNELYLKIISLKKIADDICILDWQFIRYVSPALDILCNIFSSTDKKLRDNDYLNLLKLYYESLSKMVEMLGSNPDKLFTFENLMEEMKKCGNYALILAPIVIAVSTDAISSLDETFKKVAAGESGQNSFSSINNESQLRFNERLEGLLDDIIKYGYYRKMSTDQLNRLHTSSAST